MWASTWQRIAARGVCCDLPVRRCHQGDEEVAFPAVVHEVLAARAQMVFLACTPRHLRPFAIVQARRSTRLLLAHSQLLTEARWAPSTASLLSRNLSAQTFTGSSDTSEDESSYAVINLNVLRLTAPGSHDLANSFNLQCSLSSGCLFIPVARTREVGKAWQWPPLQPRFELLLCEKRCGHLHGPSLSQPAVSRCDVGVDQPTGLPSRCCHDAAKLTPSDTQLHALDNHDDECV